MGAEQGKTTMSEPSFAENTGQHSLGIKNRFLLYENNYLRCINNLLSEISEGQGGKSQFAELNWADVPAPLELDEYNKECQKVHGENAGAFALYHVSKELELCDDTKERNPHFKGCEFLPGMMRDGKPSTKNGTCKCCIPK